MQTSTASPSDDSGFVFVQQLASELSAGKVDLPGFPDVAMRVRQALQDENVSVDKLTRIVGAEPQLAARMLQMANSAAINVSGKRVEDLRMAIARIGFNLVRSTSISYAMSQLAQSEQLKALRDPLRRLWQRSAQVAAMAHVVSKRFTQVNADAATLAGILHGIGRLYLLVRSAAHPELFARPEAYARVEQLWHANIAKAVLENWELSEDVVAAVHGQEDLEYSHFGDADLADVLIVSNLLVDFRERPDEIELNLQGVKPALRMSIDAAAFRLLLEECGAELEALRAALGA